MVDRAEPLAEGGDRVFVGQVDALGADPGLAGVGGTQPLLVTAGRDDAGARVQGGQHDGAGQAAPSPDHQHGLVLQCSSHYHAISRILNGEWVINAARHGQ